MIITWFFRIKYSALASLFCLALFSHAYGLSSDFEQPIEIEADFAELE